MHHGDNNACACAMAEPKRAFLFSVLKVRVKQTRKQLHGQWFKSDVVNLLLNKPPRKANRKAPDQDCWKFNFGMTYI